MYNFYRKIIFHKYLLSFELNDELRFLLKTVTSNCLGKLIKTVLMPSE